MVIRTPCCGLPLARCVAPRWTASPAKKLACSLTCGKCLGAPEDPAIPPACGRSRPAPSSSFQGEGHVSVGFVDGSGLHTPPLPNSPLLWVPPGPWVPDGAFPFSCHWYPPSCCGCSPIHGRQQIDDVCLLATCSLGLQASALHGPEPDKAQVSDSK